MLRAWKYSPNWTTNIKVKRRVGATSTTSASDAAPSSPWRRGGSERGRLDVRRVSTGSVSGDVVGLGLELGGDDGGDRDGGGRENGDDDHGLGDLAPLVRFSLTGVSEPGDGGADPDPH